MQDWFRDLREEKELTIAQIRERETQESAQRQATLETCQRDQSEIISSLKVIQVEALLQQFMNDVLQDHPLFSAFSLSRTVMSRTVDGPTPIPELSPWSDTLQNHLWPENQHLANGRYIARVEWTLGLTPIGFREETRGAFDIVVVVTANSVHVNDQSLRGLTPGDLANALRHAFRISTQQVSATQLDQRHRRRHKRRWYNRLWRRFLPTDRSLWIYALTILVIITLVTIVLGFYWGQIGNFINWALAQIPPPPQ
jgi:hypothetical protein